LDDNRRDPSWVIFDILDLIEQQVESGRSWLPFLDVSTMSVGLYALPAGGIDHQEPHEQDELYYVVSGRAMIQVAGETTQVGPGSLIYVKAHKDHGFLNIEDDLQVLVFFSAAEPQG
jgi:quercetin dioxygenase-like cupin family protein